MISQPHFNPFMVFEMAVTVCGSQSFLTVQSMEGVFESESVDIGEFTRIEGFL